MKTARRSTPWAVYERKFLLRNYLFFPLLTIELTQSP